MNSHIFFPGPALDVSTLQSVVCHQVIQTSSLMRLVEDDTDSSVVELPLEEYPEAFDGEPEVMSAVQCVAIGQEVMNKTDLSNCASVRYIDY